MMPNEENEFFMRRCLELASLALGQTYPNPMVGSVVVHEGKIVGEGWHHKAGEPHAEIMALESVENKSLLSESTIYVNLEPCAHQGRTPSCAMRLAEIGVKKVVYGMSDPNEKVNGQGEKILKNAGVEVESGVLADECAFLNRRFLVNMLEKRPYIILKWAQSQDGFMDKGRREPNNGPLWISNMFSRQLVHKWRAEESAILVGYKTVLVDNPELTTRLVSGRNPIRLINDPKSELRSDRKVFNDAAMSIRLSLNDVNIKAELSRLWKDMEISSIIVEGGRKTLDLFINAGLWDESRVFTGNIELKKGTKAPTLIDFDSEQNFDIEGDHLSIKMRSKR